MRRMRCLALGLTALLLFTACTDDEGGQAGSTETPAGAEPTEPPAAEPSEVAQEETEPPDEEVTEAPDDTGAGATEGETEGDAGRSDSTLAGSEPLAVLESDQDGLIRAEITRFERVGQVVELSFAIVNARDEDGDGWGAGWGHLATFFDGGLEGDDPASGSIHGVTLVDGVNNTRHYALRDGEGRCACSYDRVTVQPTGALGLFASFPAPPEDVETMSVQIPQFGSVEVELQ